jgi:hypothetical protein
VQYQHNCYNGNEEKCNWQNGGRDTTNIRLHLSNYHPQRFEELQSEKTRLADEPLKSSCNSVAGFFKSQSSSVVVHRRNPLPHNSKAYHTLKLNLTRMSAHLSFKYGGST